MASLLDEVLEAHGGLGRWRQFSRVEADAVTGGGMFPLKGLMPDLCAFRRSRPPATIDRDHPFRRIATTHYDRSRPV